MKQKILKPEGKVVVISDYREKAITEQLKSLGATVSEMNLEVGDFVCSDRVAVERKEHSDFVSSIINGRIFEQAEELQKNFKKPIIVIEGYSDRQINENALKAAVASLITNYNISLINTKNLLDTARMIYWTAKKEQAGKKRSVSFKVGKKSKDMKRLKAEIVSCLPGISSIMSKRLLEHFGSVGKVFSASELELQKVKGVGKKLSQKIKWILTEKY